MSRRRPFAGRKLRFTVPLCGGTPGPEYRGAKCGLPRRHASPEHVACGDGWFWSWRASAKRRVAS